jgi:hypothetical protein
MFYQISISNYKSPLNKYARILRTMIQGQLPSEDHKITTKKTAPSRLITFPIAFGQVSFYCCTGHYAETFIVTRFHPNKRVFMFGGGLKRCVFISMQTEWPIASRLIVGGCRAQNPSRL